MRLRKDGSRIEVSLSISPIKSPSGTTIGISKVARDITETNKTRQALRQQTEELRRIFETSQDLILVMDAQGISGSDQPELRSHTGLSAGGNDRPQRRATSSIPTISRTAREEMRAGAARAARRRFPIRAAFTRTGGIVSLSWMGTWSEPVKRFFFVGRDMTESRLAQETLRESEQLARGIIDTALDAFVQIDEQGLIRDWNSQAENIFGWSRDEALGNNVVRSDGPVRTANGPLKNGLQPSCAPATRSILSRRRETRGQCGATARRSRSN